MGKHTQSFATVLSSLALTDICLFGRLWFIYNSRHNSVRNSTCLLKWCVHIVCNFMLKVNTLLQIILHVTGFLDFIIVLYPKKKTPSITSFVSGRR